MTALLTVSPTIMEAKQDAWISMAIGAFIAVALTFVATKLSLLYPRQTLVEYSQTILGKWLGKLIMIPYFAMWYSVTAIILRQFTDFMVLNMLPRTPLLAIIIPMALIVAIAASGGPESIGRLSEIVGPFTLVMVILLAIFLVRESDHSAILPVYIDTGWSAILKGALPGATLLGESIVMMMLVSFMSQPGQAPSRAMWGVTIAGLSLVLWTMIPLMAFGATLAANMWFPVYDAVRLVYVIEFIQNIEIFGIIVWFFSVFIKLSLFMFIASYGTAQWLGIKKWRHVLWIITFIVIIGAMIPRNIDQSSIEFPKTFGLKWMFPINIIAIPLILWIVGLVRRKAKPANTLPE